MGVIRINTHQEISRIHALREEIRINPLYRKV